MNFEHRHIHVHTHSVPLLHFLISKHSAIFPVTRLRNLVSFFFIMFSCPFKSFMCLGDDGKKKRGKKRKPKVRLGKIGSKCHRTTHFHHKLIIRIWYLKNLKVSISSREGFPSLSPTFLYNLSFVLECLSLQYYWHLVLLTI